MMRQKSLFNPKLAFEDIKQSKHIILLYTVALLLCTLFPACMCYSNYLKNTESHMYVLRDVPNYLTVANPLVMILTVAAAFLFVIIRFSYLYKQSSVIFTHSMPYTRANILVTKYISGLLMLIVPIVAVGFLNILTVKIMGIKYLVSYKAFTKAIVYAVLSLWFCYSAFVLAQSVSSGVFALIISSAFLFLIYPVSKGVIFALVSMYFKSYSVNTLFGKELGYIYPFAHLCDLDDVKEALTPTFAAYLAIASLIMLFASVIIYTKRKSENSNKFFAFNAVNNFLQYYITIFLSLGVGVITCAASNGSFGISYIMYVISAILIFAVLQAIFDKNIKNMFTNKMSLAAIIVAVSAIVCIFNFDIFGIDKLLPNPDKTEKITIGIPIESGTYYSDNKFDFTDKTVIEKSILLMKTGERDFDRVQAQTKDIYHIEFETEKHKKLGISRRIYIAKDEYNDLLLALFKSGELTKQYAVDENDIYECRWISISGFGNEGYSFTIETQYKIKNLLTTYSKEIQDVTEDEFINKKAIGEIEAQITYDKNSIYPRTVFKNMPIYESCEKTVELADKYYEEWDEARKRQQEEELETQNEDENYQDIIEQSEN